VKIKGLTKGVDRSISRHEVCTLVRMDIRMDGKVALVTGASRGIGLAIAQRLCEAGANVLLVSRKADGLAEAVATLAGLDGEASYEAAHVASEEEAIRTVGICIERYGRLDVLVNNAGTNPYFGHMIDIDESRMTKTYEVNQASLLLWAKAAWHQWMAEHGGVMLNMASVGGLNPEPGIGWYNVTKAADIHITKQLAYELGPKVRVNGIAPGLVKTELARALWESEGAKIAKKLPLGRLGEPDDIATAALFLVSDASSWMTGQTIAVDGGTTSMPTGGVG